MKNEPVDLTRLSPEGLLERYALLSRKCERVRDELRRLGSTSAAAVGWLRILEESEEESEDIRAELVRRLGGARRDPR